LVGIRGRCDGRQRSSDKERGGNKENFSFNQNYVKNYIFFDCIKSVSEATDIFTANTDATLSTLMDGKTTIVNPRQSIESSQPLD
jgi:hypothetical protein